MKSGKFDEVHLQMLEYVKNSKIDIDYDSGFSTVDIYDNLGASIFMQGEEAAEFIDNIENQASDVFYEENEYDVALLFCYDYADMLCE